MSYHHHHQSPQASASSPASNYVTYADSAPGLDSSRHFYQPYPTSTLTSIYSPVVTPDVGYLPQHLAQQQHQHHQQHQSPTSYVMPTRSSSALPHKQHRIASPMSTVSARRFNSRYDDGVSAAAAAAAASYNTLTGGGVNQANASPIQHGRFRRSASTDAILRQDAAVPAVLTASAASTTLSHSRLLASAAEEEVSMRETREIVANIEKLLSNK